MTGLSWDDAELRGEPLALIGDIGATNTRLALVRGELLVAEAGYATQTLSGVEPLINQFFSEAVQAPELQREVSVCCFGVAGPVIRGEAHLTNVGWAIKEAELRDLLDAPSLLVNDFYAQAVAMPLLGRDSLVHICGPDEITPRLGQSIAVLGAGSGLGEAILTPAQHEARPYDATAQAELQTDTETSEMREWVAIATEGGHARFAPRNEAEVGLHRWLQGRHGEHVSVERVVSGPGLVEIFQYLIGGRALPDGFTEPLHGAMISRAALEDREPTARQALAHFVGVYADEAANLTLKSNAGVVFLSGGITPQILPAIHEHFQGAFINKGRYRSQLAQVSVWAVTAPKPGLFGAQVLAHRLFETIRHKS